MKKINPAETIKPGPTNYGFGKEQPVVQPSPKPNADQLPPLK